MQLTYSQYTAKAPVRCSSCGWQGNAGELHLGEYYPESNITDLDCPQCHERLCFVQFPVDSGKPYDREEDKKYW